MSPTCVDQMAAIFTERAVIFSPGSIDSDHSYFYFDSLPSPPPPPPWFFLVLLMMRNEVSGRGELFETDVTFSTLRSTPSLIVGEIGVSPHRSP